MTKPDFIPDFLFFVGAVAILAFTISDEWTKPEVFGPQASLSTNKENIIKSLNFFPGLKTNPPHGQPGHQCGIPVGAALNSQNPGNGSTTSDPATLALKNLGNQTPLGNLTTALQTTNNSSAITASSGLNPAHGQPGHRCDIAVGAPLNSAPSASQNTVANTTAASIAPKNNPAHGQPYHRCDIAVGAPLDSKPVVSKPATVSPVTNSPLIKTDTTTATYTYDSTGARLNPAHGMPGHDCTVPVGKPLKS